MAPSQVILIPGYRRRHNEIRMTKIYYNDTMVQVEPSRKTVMALG